MLQPGHRLASIRRLEQKIRNAITSLKYHGNKGESSNDEMLAPVDFKTPFPSTPVKQALHHIVETRRMCHVNGRNNYNSIRSSKSSARE